VVKKKSTAGGNSGARGVLLLLLAIGPAASSAQQATSEVFSKALLEAIEVTHLAGTCAWKHTASESFLDSATSISSYLGSEMVKKENLDLSKFIDYQSRILTRPYLDSWLARWNKENKGPPPCDGAYKKLWEQRQNDIAAGGASATRWDPLVETLARAHQQNYWTTSSTRCSRTMAERLDDRRSDATMIATAAIDYCAEPILKWVRAFGLPEDDKAIATTLVEVTTLYVQRYRAEHPIEHSTL